MKNTTTALSRKQKATLLMAVCCLIYFSAYLCRINISSALPKLTDIMGITSDLAGRIGTTFFITYALGQLINGYLVSQWRPHIVIFVALAGSGLLNIGIGLTNSYYMVMALWGLNGIFQSLFWSAISRLIGIFADKSGRKSATIISLSYPCGYIVSWSVIGTALAGVNDWHPYFYIPGMILIVLIIVWFFTVKKVPEVKTLQEESTKRSVAETLRYLVERKLMVFVAICILNGIIREGVFFWAPLLLKKILEGTSFPSTIAVGIVPAAMIPGILVARVLAQKTNDDYPKICTILYGTAFAAALILLISCITGGSSVIFIIMITIISFAICSVHSVMTGFIPMKYSSDNMSSSIIGIFDCCTYLGAAITTYALGNIMKSDNLLLVTAFWAGAAALGLLILVCVKRRGEEQK